MNSIEDVLPLTSLLTLMYPGIIKIKIVTLEEVVKKSIKTLLFIFICALIFCGALYWQSPIKDEAQKGYLRTFIQIFWCMGFASLFFAWCAPEKGLANSIMVLLFYFLCGLYFVSGGVNCQLFFLAMLAAGLLNVLLLGVIKTKQSNEIAIKLKRPKTL